MSKIIETDTFEDVLEYIIPSTFVFCDLDNTLMECSQYHGSIQWLEDFQKQFFESGDSFVISWERAHNLWIETLPSVAMQLVDNIIPEIIQKIAGNEKVFGLTARPPDIATITFSQLDQLQIGFEQTESLNLKQGTSYDRGIIFCDRGNKKSEVLIPFLRQIELPKRIVFIDDKLSHVQDVESCLASLGVEFVGIHYVKSDKRFRGISAPLVESIKNR